MAILSELAATKTALAGDVRARQRQRGLRRQTRRQEEEQRQQQELRQDIGQRLAIDDVSGARLAALGAGQLDVGLRLGDLQRQREAATGKRRQAALGELGTLAGGILSLPDAEQEPAFRASVPQFQGIMKRAGLPFDPQDTGFDRAQLQALAAQADKLPERADAFTLGPGQRRFGPTGEEIAAVDKPADTADPQKLRKEFAQRQKDFAEQERAMGRIEASAQDPSPAGDLALIFNFMKMQDPASVVRESEFRTAALAGSFGQRIQAAVAQVVSGQRLTPAQRNDFINTSRAILQNARQGAERDVDFFRSIATESGIDPALVVNPQRFPVRAEGQPDAQPAAPAAGGFVRGEDGVFREQ